MLSGAPRSRCSSLEQGAEPSNETVRGPFFEGRAHPDGTVTGGLPSAPSANLLGLDIVANLSHTHGKTAGVLANWA
jgi:hypothetical protein